MPFPENTPTPDDLPSLSPSEIATLPVELLAILQLEIDERLKRDKAAKTRFDAALAIRYAALAAEERQLSGKDTGTVRFDDGDFTIVADLPKRVEWDQVQLAGLVERIRADGADPTDYVDISYSVSERKYNAWHTDIRQEVEPARTVLTGKPKYRLVLGEEVR